MAIYRVASSTSVTEELRQLYHRAVVRGQGEVFVTAIRLLYQRLTTDPHSLGEPTFRFHVLDLTNFAALVPPLAVEFCIDEERRIVYMRRVILTD